MRVRENPSGSFGECVGWVKISGDCSPFALALMYYDFLVVSADYALPRGGSWCPTLKIDALEFSAHGVPAGHRRS